MDGIVSTTILELKSYVVQSKEKIISAVGGSKEKIRIAE